MPVLETVRVMATSSPEPRLAAGVIVLVMDTCGSTRVVAQVAVMKWAGPVAVVSV